jgi:sugar lactone lactonase YvrE
VRLQLPVLRVLMSILACSGVVSCSGGSIPVTTRGIASTPDGSIAMTLYAYSPAAPLLAAYGAKASGPTKPQSLLEGPHTHLIAGNGIAVDVDGTVYVVSPIDARSASRLQLLVFAVGAHGDAPPIRTAILDAPLLPGYAVGLALDGHGNFWITGGNSGLFRFPTSATGITPPNATIHPTLDTPIGFKPANPENVVVGPEGTLYCACSALFQGQSTRGVTAYRVLRSGESTVLRSFFDPNLPEVAPSQMAIDASGTLYMASVLNETGIYAFDSKTKTGEVLNPPRIHGSRAINYVSSLVTDAERNLYVAVGSRIAVFGPHAHGTDPPLRWISDTHHLHYSENNYGTLLALH